MARFFCCLPLRVGAWFFTALFFAWGTVLTVLGWYGYSRYDDSNLALNRQQRVALIITTASWTILPVATLFGFAALLAKSIRFTKAYGYALSFQVGSSVGAGAYFLYTLYRRGGNGAFVDGCAARAGIDQEDCFNAFRLLRGIITAVYIFIWIVMIWGGVTLFQYVDELKEKAGGGDFSRILPEPTLPNVNPMTIPPPEPPVLQAAPAPRFGPRASPGNSPQGGQGPPPAFVPNAGGISLPPPVPFNGGAAPLAQGQYAFATQRNSFGPQAQQNV